MMRCRLVAQLSVLSVSVLVLAAGDVGVSGREPEVEVNPTSSSTNGGVAQVMVTASGEAQPVTPTSTIFIATAPNTEPIVKAVPTGPVPTPGPPQLPAGQVNFDADGDGFYTFEEFQQAVAALYPSYEWPDTYQVDPATLLSGYAPYADRSRFEVGGEYTIIGMRHQCAWQLAWLDGYRSGDEALMVKSLDQLRKDARENPMMDASTGDYLEDMIQRAELGDPAMLQQYVDSTCESMDFITSAPGTPPVASPSAAATPGR